MADEPTEPADQPAVPDILSEWFGEEPLHDDLAPFLYQGSLGPMIHHPFVIEPMFQPILAKRVNRMYVEKSKAAKEALHAGNWPAYINMHERPYRLGALDACLSEGLDGEDYWHMVGMVWTDSENIHEGLDVWRELWTMSIAGREAIMKEDEQAALHALPDLIPVWRGCTVPEGVLGMSWTTNRDKAIWFARRYASRKNRASFLTDGLVRKEHVLAHFLGRNEYEIVALPEHVEIGTTEKLR